MKVVVMVKRVADPNVNIRVKEDGSGVDLENVKMAINPFCEIAVEEAIQLKDKGQAKEVVAVSVGGKDSEDQLRTALAVGADRGILVEAERDLEPLAVSKLIAKVLEEENPDLVILGKQAIDSENSQVGQMVAALMGFSQGTFASELTLKDGEVEVTREVDSGLQTLSLKLPAIITADLRLNEPRYASLPNIMKAKRKPITTVSAEDMSVDITPRIQTLQVEAPTDRKAGKILSSVKELVEKLRTHEELI
ncbi:electron transfer flavoprotein subunit beta/FixA family protein [Pseudomaricurvus alkylphenolicus]|uniref:electron transfer flavoprotein subunit beta/FixA family protein n=1 Tax=Pseudomaricurvus alkylphenolicus TaxID=1306991 RepID=UPI00141F478D|nr:electron transfer flavoprotein subunit beta/FixA family protein [Pseudomaricurvus alkylphenolicus]NIB43517.1 electron transfer flavoprotein subunit beta/FixA family protein [Pseudomaricurvus alkylphenolicus]